MCGFAAYINIDNKSYNSSVIFNMTKVQRHRGPDDTGLLAFSTGNGSYKELKDGYFEDLEGYNCAIGFNRLSILDLSLHGHQPMFNSEKNVFIVFNGEVYNAFSYKQDLINKGYKFRSETDTEVLLYLYIEYGIEQMLERLNGMFAFFIGDLRTNTYYVARDHFGIKPLYYYKTENDILFSSEIKSFFEYPDFRAEIEEKHIEEFIYFRYNAYERTLLKNVNQLPPAHYIEIKNNNFKIHKYWEPDLTTKQIKEDEALYQLEFLLKQSIESQLISDVKVGCQLSGGIDSSLVTTYAREHFSANMDTFSIVFDNKAFSEEHWIDLVTNKTKSDSHRFMFLPDYIIKNIRNATWHLDLPINLPNTLGIMKLAEGSRQNVTVLLSGEGADELMGGYARFFDLMFRYKNEKLLKVLSKIPSKGRVISNKYKLNRPLEEFIVMSNSSVSEKQFKALRPDGDLDRVIRERMSLIPESGDILKRMIVYELRTHLVDLLNRQDKMTMANSLENRVPFLDRNLVDFVFGLPSELLVSKTGNIFNYNKPNNFSKHLLKKLTVEKYDNEFAYRQKSGFPLPLDEYFKDPEIISLMENKILPNLYKHNIIDSEIVKKIWQKRNRTKSDNKLLWMFLSLELWIQIFIEKTC